MKSNRPEQKHIQSFLKKSDPKIFLQIKRGESLLSYSKRKALERWQYLDNDYYGQMILAFHLQKPGTSRSGKQRLFSVTQIYDSVFKREPNKESIIDTLRIFYLYNKYVDDCFTRDKFSGPDHESIATNGKYIIPSIVGFMIKEKRKFLDIHKINDGEKVWEAEVSKDCLNDNALFINNLPDDFETRLFDLFSEICIEILSLYETRVKEEKTVSNFFKTDQKYMNVILKHIVNKFYFIENKRKVIKESYLSLFQ